MYREEMKKKTQETAYQIIRFTNLLPRNRTNDILAKQLIRSSTSVGANYRAACRARSKADFIAKLKIVEEESDESLYWLDLLKQTEPSQSKNVEWLSNHMNQILAQTVSAIKSTRLKGK